MTDLRAEFQRQIEALYTGDLTVDKVFTEDAEVVMPGRPPIKGREAIADFVRLFLVAFPDYALTIQSLVAEGDKIALEFNSAGTHTGPLRLPGREVPATGKRFSHAGVVIATRDKNGKLTSYREYFDRLEFMIQLGLIPTPARAPASPPTS